MTPTEWDALAERSGNVFATREWLATWLRHEPRDEVRTVAGRRADGTVAALLPLALHRRRPRLLRPVGPWPPPERPLICAPEDEPWALRETAAQLAASGGWDVLELDAVPARQRWHDVLRVARTASQPNHVVPLAGRSWDDLLASSSRNFRSQYRARERRLAREHTVGFRRADDPARLEADVERFLHLHWTRWGDDVAVLTPERRALLHDFAALALDRGWLALWFLELGGRAVAANLNFRFAGTEVYFMAGRDPAFSSEHVGFVLTFNTLRAAAEDGLREFRFLRGGQDYKSRMPSTDETVQTLTMTHTPLGQLAVAGAGVRRRVKGALEQREPQRARGRRHLRPAPALAPAGPAG